MPRTRVATRTRKRLRLEPRWNVILIDDDDHSYEYVIEMLSALFGHPPPAAYRMAAEVDSTGRVIVWTDSFRGACQEQERIHTYGADPRLPRSAGSMTAVLEPTE